MIYYGLVLRYKKRKKDVCIMTLKRITVSKEKATRFFLWMVGILTIPCVLYSVYFNFFWLPSQTYSAAEQEMVDAIVEISQRYGDEAGQVTVNFQHFYPLCGRGREIAFPLKGGRQCRPPFFYFCNCT